jgi:superfamily II DNA or RNA helicase
MSQTLLHPRPYQTEAIERLFTAWREGMQRPAIVLPTGSGKTVVFAHVVRHFIDAQTGPLDTLKVRPSGRARVVVLVHRDELADQAVSKLRAIAPELSVGKVKAEDNEITSDVMVCSVQTLARPSRAGRLLDAQAYAGDIGLVIVDECHHALSDSYRNVMAALGCYDPDSGTVAVGFTATLARGDGRGLGDVWQDVVFTRSVLKMIADGFLTDVRAQQIDLENLDLKSVKRSKGDYQVKDLGQAMQDAGAPEVIRQVIEKHAAGRRSILVFTPTVALAQETAQTLNGAGITAGIVHGGTPRPERLALYEGFRTGNVRVVVNCMVLTEGADFPYADCAVIARPTSNETLAIQMMGRVLRPSPATGKTDALILFLSGQGGSIRTLIDLEPEVIVPVLDGESLAEAYERQEEIRESLNGKEKTRPLRLQLKTKDLDLFKASAAYQWLRTKKGVQFIPLGGAGEILLWPAEGLWDVVWAPAERKVPWQRLHTGLELSMAMAWGESEAEERSAINTGKGASWRKKKASEAQVNYAARLGQDVPEGARAGEVGDLISVSLASRKIDRFVRS